LKTLLTLNLSIFHATLALQFVKIPDIISPAVSENALWK